MADQKLTALVALATPVNTDILYIVDDPGGVPLSKKITRENLLQPVLIDIDTLGPNAADSEFLVGTGAGALAWESGATVRTSLGLGIADTPTFAGLTIDGASVNALLVEDDGVEDNVLVVDTTHPGVGINATLLGGDSLTVGGVGWITVDNTRGLRAKDAGGANAILFQFNAADDIIFGDSTGRSDDMRYFSSGTEVLKLDNNATAQETRLLVYDVDNAALERVSVGIADSGGVGFKVLRIAN